ncbi:phosphatase PAP2 family protein [Sinomonas soli]
MLKVTASARRALAAALAAAGLIAFGWLLESVAGNWSLADLDWPVLDGLAAHRSGPATAAAHALSAATGPAAVLAASAVVAAVWAVWRRELWRPALLAGASLADFLLVMGARYWVGRSRPPAWFEAVGGNEGPAFPSAHTAGAATLLFVGLYLVYSRRSSTRGLPLAALGAGVLVLAVAASDLYLGRHWLTDVAASFSIGAIVLAAVLWVDALRTPEGGRGNAAVAASRAPADT